MTPKKNISFQKMLEDMQLPTSKGGFDCWSLFHEVAPHADRILLHGPPGTGKTRMACEQINDGETAINLTLTEEMPAAELRGHYVPRGGEFVWMDGPAVTAWRTGGLAVINEIGSASADALSFMISFLDDKEIAYMVLPSGEIVRPKESFRCIATTNVEPEDLPFALRDRFDVVIHIDKPHPEALRRLPENLRNAAQAGTGLTDDRKTSLRSWLAFTALREKTNDETAAKAVFGTRYRDVLSAIKVSSVK